MKNKYAVDQTSDNNGQQLYRLTKLYELPDFVKTASSDDIYGTDDLENHQYADATHRQFPCHTAAATYLSTLFFMDKRAEMDEGRAEMINARLDDFAFMHDVSQSVQRLKEKATTLEKTAASSDLTDEAFALVLDVNESQTGRKERHYPLRNGIEVKKAAEYLQKYRDELPYFIRNKMASNILNKAQELGVGLGDLDELLMKTAGVGVCAAQEAVELLFDRARLYKKANQIDFAFEIGTAAKVIAERPETVQDNDAMVKLANLVDQIDREVGLNKWIDDLPKPEDVFFNITEKVASRLRNEHFATASGNIYKSADVGGLKLADIKSIMGEDFSKAISSGGLIVSSEKLAEVVPTLPQDDAELFDRMLNSFGITPVAKEAARTERVFDSAELLALAGNYRR